MPTIKIPMTDWKPDSSDLNSKLIRDLSGVLPAPNGYAPWQQFAPISAALPTEPHGSVMTRRQNGTRDTWTGTHDKLWKLNQSTLGWTDVSRLAGGAYNCAQNERWTFLQFGDHLIAANVNDATQWIDIEVGSNFVPLPGSPPQAKFGAVVKDFVMFGNTADDPNELRWSGSNMPDFWTIGTNQSDHQIFPDGGPITAVVGGEVGFVFQEDCVRRLTYVGPPTIFNIDKIEASRGCKAPFSIVQVGSVIYYYAPDGFTALNTAGQSVSIGAQILNDFFLADANTVFIKQMRGIADPTHTRVFWLYWSNSATSYGDTLLCFDYAVNRWSKTRVQLSEIGQTAAPGVTLDGLPAAGYPDLDAMVISLDDDRWKGNMPVVGAFDAQFRLGSFSGKNQEAVVVTADYEGAAGQRTFVRGVRPLCDAAEMRVKVGRRSRPNDTMLFTAEQVPQLSTGMAPFRTDGRYLRVQLRVPAEQVWSKILGVDVDGRQSGAR